MRGPPTQSVEELVPFVLERGFSTPTLMADDQCTIELWGGEVAPALREALAHGRRNAGGPYRGGITQ